MARIPEADELGYRSPQAVSQVVAAPNIQVDPGAYGQPMTRRALGQIQETIANEELAKAEVQFQVAMIDETQKAEADSDIDTIEERYLASTQDQLGKAAAGITDQRVRSLFLTRGEAGLAKANAQMANSVRRRKNDREKGYMVNAIDAMVKGGTNLEYGDPAEAGLGIQLALDSMVERQVITNVEAQNLMRQATLDIAMGRLKAMSPEEQLEVLNSDDPAIQRWVNEVPPDTLRALKDQAEQQGMDTAAHNWAMNTRGVDMGAALDDMYEVAAKEDWSAEKVDKHRMRIMRIHQDDEAIRQRKVQDYLEEGAAAIHAGESTVEQILSTERGRDMFYRQFTEAERNNLRAAEDNAIRREAGEGRRYSDRATVEKMKEFIASGQVIAGRRYWSENYAKLNDADFDYFNRAFSPTKSAAPEFKPLQSTRQVMDAYLRKHPLDDEKADLLWEELGDMANTYYLETGKNPEKALVQQWVEDKHANVILEPPVWEFGPIKWGGESYLARDLPPLAKAQYEEIINVYRDAGVGAKVGTLKFNDWTQEERDQFREMRQKNPNMPADLFVATYQTMVEEDRAAAREQEAKEGEKPRRYDRRGRLIEEQL